ncbi:MAG: D-aminoacylase, partial [Sphingosinicella sp.]
MTVRAKWFALLPALLLAGCAINVAMPAGPAPAAREYDYVIRGGTIYDGSGSSPYRGDVAIISERIAYVGPRAPRAGRREIDAAGLAVAPGFINMLSWATESLIHDGNGQSDIRQGVTLQVFGEGWSMGPLNERMKALAVSRQSDIRVPIE